MSFPKAPQAMLRIAIILFVLIGFAQAMPTLEQSLFCYIPTPEVSAAFHKAVNTVSYASAQLVSAASDVRAWDLFLTQFMDIAKSFPSIWDIALEEYEARTGKTDHNLAPSSKQTVELLVDPIWQATYYLVYSQA